jgi:outer membrane protein assembly factor BamD
VGLDQERFVRRLALLLALIVPAVGCASGTPDLATLTSNSDQVIWEAGQTALKKRQYEGARQHFRRIVEGFPQSQYAPASRLAVGETYVKEGGIANDTMAIGAYREFLTLYPSHPESDTAQFQVAEAYFRQRNGADRDQTKTHEALAEYERLLELYPDTKHVEEARKRTQECRQMLARAEFLAGYFYQRTRQSCRAAIPRFEGILKEYPDYQELDVVMFRLGECLMQTGRGAEARPVLARMLEDYPKSAFAEQARQLLAAPDVPMPSPALPPATAASPSPAPASPTPPSPSPSPSPSPVP